MSLPEVVAERLAGVPGPGAPKQADLRRAISTAYYALFHKLVEEGASRFVGPRPDRDDLRRRVFGRSFAHGKMREAAALFGKDGAFCKLQPSDKTRENPFWKAMGGVAPSAELQTVADSFCELMETRHRADYDTTARFRRSQAKDLVSMSDFAIRSIDAMRESLEFDVFLAALLLERDVRNRK